MFKSQKNPRIFYGWWIVSAGFLALFISTGISVYSRSVFFKAMFSDLGWGRGELSLAMSVGIIAAAIIAPFVGRWVDNHGARRLLVLSAFLTGGFTIASSQIHVLWHAFGIFIFKALAQTGISFIPVQVMVANWFVKKRGRAMGIAMAGVGMGGFILAPLSAYLISSLGWRMAWVVLGLLTWVVIIPSALLIVRRKPEDLGLLPDGETSEDRKLLSEAEKPKETRRKPPISSEWMVKAVLRIPTFWLLAGVWLLFFFAQGGIMVHSFALYTDKGISAITAGTLVGTTGLFSIIGKLTLGYLSERIPVRYVMGSSILLRTISIFLLLVGPVWIVWPFVMLFGFSMAVTGLQPLLVASCFGITNMGTILGALNIASSISWLLSPIFMGYAFDINNSYNLALSVFVGAAALAAGLTFLARPPKRITSLITGENQ